MAVKGPETPAGRRLAPYLIVSLAPLFWSGNFVLGRALHETVPPIALSFWRWVVALLLLLPFVSRGLCQQLGLIRRHWGILSLLGLLGVASYNRARRD